MNIYIYAAVSNGKQKTEAQAMFTKKQTEVIWLQTD
jgi:hypothetical protein